MTKTSTMKVKLSTDDRALDDTIFAWLKGAGRPVYLGDVIGHVTLPTPVSTDVERCYDRALQRLRKAGKIKYQRTCASAGQRAGWVALCNMTKTVSFSDLLSLALEVQAAQDHLQSVASDRDHIVIADAQHALCDAQAEFTTAVKKFNGSFA